MSNKFPKMIELCRRNFFKCTNSTNMDVPRLRFWMELEAEVLKYQSQVDGWNKFKNYISGIGASGSPEVNRFCIILLDKMETL